MRNKLEFAEDIFIYMNKLLTDLISLKYGCGIEF